LCKASKLLLLKEKVPHREEASKPLLKKKPLLS
jgi:hypothetical protein